MILHPAIHIAYFGVFPNRPIDDDLVESFTAFKAETHACEVASANRRDTLTREALLDMEESTIMDSIYDTARIRLRSAYQFAAREGWIQPITGAVILPGLIQPAADDDMRAELEMATYRAFTDYTDGLIQANFSMHYPHTEPPVARVAHIRCVLNGKTEPFLTVSDATSSFFAVAHPRLQAEVDSEWFNFAPIDTVAHCRSNPLYKRSFFMGYTSGGRAPA